MAKGVDVLPTARDGQLLQIAYSFCFWTAIDFKSPVLTTLGCSTYPDYKYSDAKISVTWRDAPRQIVDCINIRVPAPVKSSN